MIAAAIDRRISCSAERRSERCIYVDSTDEGGFALDLDEADFSSPCEGERNTSKAIVRGMAAALMERGACLSGCSLSFASDIPIGMGLSSSAAFELCAGAALLAMSDASHAVEMAPMDLARAAMRVEQRYFGKPCGLMDQAACAIGGMVCMDFSASEDPKISKLSLPVQWGGYDYLLVSTGSGHEHMTSDYAGVAADMRSVALLLGIAQLRDMPYQEYLAHMPRVRAELGDSAALRALGFYIELDLVEQRLRALRDGDMRDLMRLTDRSGVCSAEYLQNVALSGRNEPAMVALALSRSALDYAKRTCGGDTGSARIHGGGFGGTIQVILPSGQSAHFEARICELMGFDCCMHVCLGASGIEVCGEA